MLLRVGRRGHGAGSQIFVQKLLRFLKQARAEVVRTQPAIAIFADNTYAVLSALPFSAARCESTYFKTGGKVGSRRSTVNLHRDHP